MSIKEMVKNKTVRFLYYKEQDLFYITECGFKFPVPISDVGTASMKVEDKAIMFMRWIKRELDVQLEIAAMKKENAKALQREVDADERYYNK